MLGKSNVELNSILSFGPSMKRVFPFSASQLSTTNFSLYNTYKIWHLMMTKWELIKQSQLLKIKSQILSILFNEKYGLRLGEFKNTTGTERVKSDEWSTRRQLFVQSESLIPEESAKDICSELVLKSLKKLALHYRYQMLATRIECTQVN